MPKPKTLEELYQQITLTPEKETEIASFFQREVEEGLAARKELETRWERALRLYDGKREEKNHPWKGASNIHIPLVAVHASAIHARFMTTLFTPEPFWRVKAKAPDLQDFSRQATEYLDWSRQNQFNFYTAVRDFAWDSIKLGIGVMKVTWQRIRGPEVRYVRNQKNGKLEIVEDEVDIFDGPRVEAIPPHKFVWKSGYDDIQKAPWICHIMEFTRGEIKRMGKNKLLFNTAKADGSATISKEPMQQVRDELKGVTDFELERVKLYEIWGRYDYNGDGIEEELQIVIDPLSYTVLRINPIPFFHRKRPFVVGALERREHSIAGTGIADQIGDLNDEINTVHNQMVDATTTSIVSMYGVRAGSPTEAALEKIWPSKRIPLANMDDVKEIGMGPLKVSSLPLEEYVRGYAERRTGISDFGLGREPSPSRRGTATGTLAIIQEGNRKFDFQIRDMRDPVGDVGAMLLSMMQQNNPAGIIQQVLGPDGAVLTTLQLNFPEEPIMKAVSVEVVASSAAVNRQVQRQDAMTLFGVLNQFYQQSFQLGMLLSQPGIPPPMFNLAMQLAKASDVLMKEILVSFENRRADELLPDLEEVYAQIAQFGQLTTIAAVSGVGGAPPTDGGAGAPRPGAGNSGAS